MSEIDSALSEMIVENELADKERLDSLMKEAADKTVKSPRLIQAEKAVSQRPQMSPNVPFRTAPRPTPKPVPAPKK